MISGRLYGNSNYVKIIKEEGKPNDFNLDSIVNIDLLKNFERIYYYIDLNYKELLYKFIDAYLAKYGNNNSILYPFILHIIVDSYAYTSVAYDTKLIGYPKFQDKLEIFTRIGIIAGQIPFKLKHNNTIISPLKIPYIDNLYFNASKNTANKQVNKQGKTIKSARETIFKINVSADSAKSDYIKTINKYRIKDFLFGPSLTALLTNNFKAWYNITNPKAPVVNPNPNIDNGSILINWIIDNIKPDFYKYISNKTRKDVKDTTFADIGFQSWMNEPIVLDPNNTNLLDANIVAANAAAAATAAAAAAAGVAIAPDILESYLTDGILKQHVMEFANNKLIEYFRKHFLIDITTLDLTAIENLKEEYIKIK